VARDEGAKGGVVPGGLAVVVPVLNEEARIEGCLAALRVTPGVGEIVVVDGGSRDRTVALARDAPGVRILIAPGGRGPQMNAGAGVATAAVLLFLHADVTLPGDAAARIAAALADRRVVAGAFRTHTAAEGARSWVTPLLPLADLRSRMTRLPYGDQALFVRRSVFEAVGGFPDQPLMEDVELARRLRRVGRIVRVPAVVEVSGRRFAARPIASLLAMRVFPLLYRLGVPPQVLARLYGEPR
jgi:rSAM/selenodomain-associated transferase 2